MRSVAPKGGGCGEESPPMYSGVPLRSRRFGAVRASLRPTEEASRFTHRVMLDSCHIPGYPDPRCIGGRGISILYLELLLKDRGCPVDVLQPMPRGAHRQKVRADLREEVAREWNPRGLRERCGPEPARDPADLHGVWHHVVGSTRLDALSSVVWPPPVLSDLDRGFGIAPDLRMARVVVGASGLFYPVESFILQCRGAPTRLSDGERLIVVRHQ